MGASQVGGGGTQLDIWQLPISKGGFGGLRVPCWKKKGHLALGRNSCRLRLGCPLANNHVERIPQGGLSPAKPFCQIPRRDLYNQNHTSRVIAVHVLCVFQIPFSGVLGWETRQATGLMGLLETLPDSPPGGRSQRPRHCSARR